MLIRCWRGGGRGQGGSTGKDCMRTHSSWKCQRVSFGERGACLTYRSLSFGGSFFWPSQSSVQRASGFGEAGHGARQCRMHARTLQLASILCMVRSTLLTLSTGLHSVDRMLAQQCPLE